MARLARGMGARVLAVNIFPPPSHLPTKYIDYSHALVGHVLRRAGDNPTSADVLVEPELTEYNMIHLKHDELIALWRAAMEEKLGELVERLA